MDVLSYRNTDLATFRASAEAVAGEGTIRSQQLNHAHRFRVVALSLRQALPYQTVIYHSAGRRPIADHLLPDQPSKPKMTAEERRARQRDRLTSIRPRMAILRELDERGMSTPIEVGKALGMSLSKTTDLLNRHQ
jgi:hypothetical protein